MVGERREQQAFASKSSRNALLVSLLLSFAGALGCAGDVGPELPTGVRTASDVGDDSDENVGNADDPDATADDDDEDDDVPNPPPDDSDNPGDGEGDGDGDSTGTDPTRAGWNLVWSDEFEGPQGQLPDDTKWKFDVGGTGWGNDQREFDTDRPENASLDGQGSLVITARQESYMGREYTSARLNTAGKFDRAYGRFEARMRLPEGQGIWPAFWMLGSNIGEPGVGWPNCGEIDIMESIGREPSRMYGTLHGPGYSAGESITASYDLPDGKRFVDDFHLFAVEWEPNVVRWYLDDTLYVTRTPADLPNGAAWVYDHPFFLILNLAVGGYWPGYPDGTTVFPQALTIDHVRVYEKAP
jgi:beta-glucanase (GH16 family)